MKQLFRFVVMSFVLLAVSVPFVSRVAPVAYAAKAATVNKAVPTVTPAVTPTPTPVDYSLPYPGILPDNPLYFLKNLRDRIIEILISDPINKTEFYVLQADKKLNMALTLASTGKDAEAQNMLNESLAARTQAVDTLSKIVASGKQVPGFVVEKVTLSLAKHEEVLSALHRPTDAITALMKKAAAFIKGQ